MITCGQQVDNLAKLPWDPKDTSGCCEECLAEYVANKDFTPEEAERFFPVEAS